MSFIFQPEYSTVDSPLTSHPQGYRQVAAQERFFSKKHHFILKQTSDVGSITSPQLVVTFCLGLFFFSIIILKIKPNVVCRVLDGRLIEVTTTGKVMLGRQTLML